MDYYEKYALYSNVELLKILHNKEDYQKDAIEAIEKILSERNITVEDKEEVVAFFEEEKHKKEKREQNYKIVKDYFNDIFSAILHPKEYNESGWIKILVTIIIILILYDLYLLVQSLILSFSFSTFIFNINSIAHLFNIFYFGLALYFSFKKKYYGWVMMLVIFIIQFVSILINIYTICSVNNIYLIASISYSTIYSLLIAILILYILNRKDVRNYFLITDKIRKKTIIITLTIYFILILSILIYLFIIE